VEAIIHLQNVNKQYHGSLHHVTVLDGFDLQIATGEFLALTGPSGSGKTTILNIIGGLDRPDAGTVMVAGTRLDKLGSGALAQWRSAHIGFVFQSHYLMPMLTAAANVELPLMLSRLKRADRRAKVTAALARVGLADRATHLPSQLSGGQQQRVGIARALIAEAPLLLCDEPTAGLDRHAADSILSLLADLNRGGSTIVMVTHDLHAASFASRRLGLAEQAALS
jgi:putative ABC transport system ATP-binding protein